MSGAVEDFVRVRLGGAGPPPDLAALLRAVAGQPGFAEAAENPLLVTGASLLWPGDATPSLDHDYLTDADRADADVMANVAAMRETAGRLRFVLQEEDGALLGYWQADAALPLTDCALFRLDTESQYEAAEGATLAETLAYHAFLTGGEEASAAVIAAFAALGVAIPPKDEDAIDRATERRAAAIAETPQDFRERRYRHYRKAAGLD